MAELTRVIRAGCILSLALAASGPAQAAPVVNLVTEYYPVSGSTIEDVRQQLEERRKSNAEGAEGVAYIADSITWSYGTHARGFDCVPTLVTVKLTLHISMPRLEGDAPPDVRERFETYAAAIKTHMDEHIAIHRRSVEAAETLLKTYPPTNCFVVRSQADAAVKASFKAFQDDHARYDAETHHGATQGVAF